MNEIEMTSGRLTSLSRLLEFLNLNPTADSEDALQYLVRTRQIQSEQLGNDALNLATRLGLVSKEPRGIFLTASGKSIVLGKQDELGLALQRRLLLKIITKMRRDLLWISFAQPEELKVQLPSLYQILSELKLVESRPGAEAIEFWGDLRRAEHRLNDAVLKKIGDQAESWSMIFEKNRLVQAGQGNLAEQIVWLSRESDLHGYDILSFGAELGSVFERRHIEVKRTRLISECVVEFYLSRNEYEQARVLNNKYKFHLWWVYPDEKLANLSVASSEAVLSITPSDHQEKSHWTECLIRFQLEDAEATYMQATQIEMLE